MYIKQTTVTEEIKLMQLQAACSEDLKQRVFDSGVYKQLTTHDLFIAKMKDLAVITIHKSVHLRNLWKMFQQSDEQIRAFVARLTSTADMCGMAVKCTCGENVSYRDNVIMQMVIHGMRDNDIRIRVLSRNTNGELTDLTKLVDYIHVEEAGKNESTDLSTEDGSVNAIRKSSFQKSKGKRCKYCGQQSHTENNTYEDRSKLCKAFGKVCGKCNKKDHLSSVCKSSKVSAVVTIDDKTEAENPVATNAAMTGFLCSIQPNPTLHSLPGGGGVRGQEGEVAGRKPHGGSHGALQQPLPTHPGEVHLPVQIPTTAEGLNAFVAALQNQGPVTSIPMHYMFSWLKTRNH